MRRKKEKASQLCAYKTETLVAQAAINIPRPWLNCRRLFQVPLFFFPPLKRLNHLNVLGRSSEKLDILFFFISFNVIGPEMFASPGALGPDYSNFLPSPYLNPLLSLLPLPK